MGKTGRLFFCALNCYVLDFIEELGKLFNQLREPCEKFVQLVHKHHPLERKLSHNFPLREQTAVQHTLLLKTSIAYCRGKVKRKERRGEFGTVGNRQANVGKREQSGRNGERVRR